AAGGAVFPPDDQSLPRAASWVRAILADPERATEVGDASRGLAESRFGLDLCADRFEELLTSVSHCGMHVHTMR
ncbi:MAG: glycosyltransferase WbuB, partial [Actinomycetota bacterium]|nr:glycosyltransferase WbuB [Actinomycetota bacterium]